MNDRISDRYKRRSSLSAAWTNAKSCEAQYLVSLLPNSLASVRNTGYLKHLSNCITTQLKQYGESLVSTQIRFKLKASPTITIMLCPYSLFPDTPSSNLSRSIFILYSLLCFCKKGPWSVSYLYSHSLPFELDLSFEFSPSAFHSVLLSLVSNSRLESFC